MNVIRHCLMCGVVVPRRGNGHCIQMTCPACHAKRTKGLDKHVAYLPSEDEIRIECLRIQGQWSDAEEQSRAGAGRKTPAGLVQPLKVTMQNGGVKLEPGTDQC